MAARPRPDQGGSVTPPKSVRPKAAMAAAQPCRPDAGASDLERQGPAADHDLAALDETSHIGRHWTS
ncbi:hypothetical protein NL676_018154 [Syzygium grande]|nr:hypothetical protein NL676_018154 [Syzygium grande]